MSVQYALLPGRRPCRAVPADLRQKGKNCHRSHTFLICSIERVQTGALEEGNSCGLPVSPRRAAGPSEPVHQD